MEIELRSSAKLLRASVVHIAAGQLRLRLTQAIRYLKLPEDSPVKIRYITPHGLVSLPTTTSEAFAGDDELMIRTPKTQVADQRRNLFRTDAAFPVTLRIHKTADESWISRRVYHHLTLDASGSGCSLETELPLSAEDRLSVTLWPNRPEEVNADAKVIWTQPTSTPGLQKIGLSFTSISDRSQDRLVGALLEEERLRRLS